MVSKKTTVRKPASKKTTVRKPASKKTTVRKPASKKIAITQNLKHAYLFVPKNSKDFVVHIMSVPPGALRQWDGVLIKRVRDKIIQK